jgi:hypothetical protein
MRCKPDRAILLGLITAIGCSNSSSEPSGNCPRTFPVRVDSVHAIRPLISWAPTCPAYRITVTYIDSTSIIRTVWSLQTSLSNLIASPVRYGVAPPGTTGLIGPFGITPGTTYDVEVARWDTVANGPAGSGHASFMH